MSEFGFLDDFKFLASLNFPMLAKLLDVRMTGAENVNYLRKIVKENFEKRKQDKIARNDMIDLLIKARDGQLEYDDEDDKTDIGFATAVESNVGKSSEKMQSKFDRMTIIYSFFCEEDVSKFESNIFLVKQKFRFKNLD